MEDGKLLNTAWLSSGAIRGRKRVAIPRTPQSGRGAPKALALHGNIESRKNKILHLKQELHPPSPTDPNVNRATAHRTIQPAPTNPAAPKYPHSSSILNASRFCTATAQSTPRPTDPPASSYFQTTIKIGNNFMQLLTNSAVEIPLGDDRARAWSAASSLSEFSLSMRAPSPLMPASHRIVRCCAAVVNAQRRR
ncbi:MAG: hypothetical protein L6R35_001715 [Caloplaca aegaea]|nr:MAG: hypothetical protein L6R35_001715 [Caloplaca aegaea]